MTRLELSANTVAAIAAVEVVFLAFGEFFLGREAFYAVAEEILIMLCVQIVAICIMLFIHICRERNNDGIDGEK